MPPSIPRVKVCGLTNLSDAQLAVEHGAWALGMIFYEGSPRRCSLTEAQRIARALRRKAELCGVFVNASLDEVAGVSEELGLTIAAADLQFMATLRESCVLNNDTYFDNEFHEIFVVRRDVDVASLRLDPEEVADVKWVHELRPDDSFVPHAAEYALLSRWLPSDARRDG